MRSGNLGSFTGALAGKFRTCFLMHERVSTLRVYYAAPSITMQTHALHTTEESLLLPEEAASRLRVEPGTLASWRSTGRQELPFVKVGHLVRYRASDIDKFIGDAMRCAA